MDIKHGFVVWVEHASGEVAEAARRASEIARQTGHAAVCEHNNRPVVALPGETTEQVLERVEKSPWQGWYHALARQVERQLAPKPPKGSEEAPPAPKATGCQACFEDGCGECTKPERCCERHCEGGDHDPLYCLAESCVSRGKSVR